VALTELCGCVLVGGDCGAEDMMCVEVSTWKGSQQ
jgi:hypothetical protein